MTDEQLKELVRGETVSSRFVATVRERPGAVALRWKDGDSWREWTWQEYGDRAARLAGSLADLGVQRGDRVVLMMRNRPEFHVADVAALLLGATPISIYNSSAPEQVQYLAGHCEAKLAIVEDAAYLERVQEVRGALPKLEQVVVIDPAGASTHGVLVWDALLDHEPVDLDEAATVAQPHDLATVIYTSGTTGPPKGVMIDHENVCWTVESLRSAMASVDPTGRRLVSYLPMAHIAERMVSHYQGISYGYEISTCPEPGQVAQYWPQVKPEVVFAVPRVWEKVYAGIQALLAGDDEKRAGFEKALAIGGQAAEYRARHEAMPAELQQVFDQTEAQALRPVRELLGLDQVVTAISGAAPIPIGILLFIRALGIPLSEIYGLSESSGPMTWEPFQVLPGTVGPRIPGQEVRLADDGEVCCRGGNVFRGYLNDPEKTAETLDADGWLHSGDIGAFDEQGYLRIVDRKKELIITAGGKNISPANLEAALKSFPLIGQVCVIGDQRPFISALIVLDPEVAPPWAKQHGVELDTFAELAKDPVVHAEVERCVAEANEKLSNVERIKKFTLLPDEWMPDSEELTPTMKLKRRGVNARYAAEIEAMYSR